MNEPPAPRADVPNDALLTSELYRTTNLPRRFENPSWFQGYGSQVEQNPQFQRYRPSSSEYGWFPPTVHTVAPCFYPLNQRFSSRLAQFGMYRNFSLNTAPEPRPLH
ncbi:hypothetical protein B566_EDAN004500 [Ephemera danica]|nr:hypothetical protein B566_EDAN004500 [Ephemera danica]